MGVASSTMGAASSSAQDGSSDRMDVEGVSGGSSGHSMAASQRWSRSSLRMTGGDDTAMR